MSQLIQLISQKIENGITTREIKTNIAIEPKEEVLFELTVPNNTTETFIISDVDSPKLLIFNSTHEVSLTIQNTSGGFTNIPTKNLVVEGSGWSTVLFNNTSGFEVTAQLQVYGNLA